MSAGASSFNHNFDIFSPDLKTPGGFGSPTKRQLIEDDDQDEDQSDEQDDDLDDIFDSPKKNKTGKSKKSDSQR